MVRRSLFTLAGVVLALSAATTPVHAAAVTTTGPYYLALGDSLAQGVQPDSSGASVETNQGYVDDLYAAERAQVHGLKLAKLGCPGETTGSLVAGGICHYAHGSQLGEAVAFLRTHSVAFITIDIGANDIDGCLSAGGIDQACLAAGFAAVSANLPVIMTALHTAAPGVPVYAMNYYDPFLGLWVLGGSFQTLALDSLPLAAAFNHLLGGVYRSFHAHVVNVGRAFATFDARPLPSGMPRDVQIICANTWMCVAPPVGPNIHANPAGYGVIAASFASVIGRL